MTNIQAVSGTNAVILNDFKHAYLKKNIIVDAGESEYGNIY